MTYRTAIVHHRHTLLTWAFPVISTGVALAMQILLPRLLLLNASAGEYAAYVGVVALTGYVGLAEGGLSYPVLRELTALHKAQRLGQFVGELRRAARLYCALAAVGVLLASLWVPSLLTVLGSVWAPAESREFTLAALLLIVSVGVELTAGSIHTALLFSTQRYLLGQAVNVSLALLTNGALVVALWVSEHLPTALLVWAVVRTGIGVARAGHSVQIFRKQFRGIRPEPPPRSLRRVFTDGVAIKVGDTLPTSAYPHALSIQAAQLIPVAIPCRTLTSVCGLLPQQFVNVLQVHITRRLAGSSADVRRGHEEYSVAATGLASGHLCLLALVALAAPSILAVWLPPVAPYALAVLPGLLAHQALLSVSLPASMLLVARGYLTALGRAKLLGAVLGLVGLFVLIPTVQQAAFGLALLISGVPLFVLGSWEEMLRDWREGKRPDPATVRRYLGALAAATACLFYTAAPLLAVGATLAAGLPGLASSWRVLRQAIGQIAATSRE